MKRFFKISLIVLGAVVVLVIIATVSDRSSGPKTATQETATVKKGLEVTETSSGWEGNLLFITGQVKNHSSKTYAYVQVTFNLYDDDGAQIGTAIDNVNNLEGGGVWKFKAMAMEDGVKKYKLMGVEGF